MSETINSIAPTNIAVVKYWGKNPEWERYHIPTKSSVSFTVDGLYTETELIMESGSGNVQFNLNDKEISPEMKEFEYVGDLLKKMFELVPETKKYNYIVKSKNNFPTAAGYASSASGFAAFAKALQGAMKKLEPKVYEDYMSSDKKLSVFARLGSGSATRSIPAKGGFVVWKRGINPKNCPKQSETDDETKKKIIFSSYSKTLFKPEYWPEFRIVYAKVQEKEKKIKSRAGMKTSVENCPVYWDWVKYEEKVSMPGIIESVKNKDFPAFAKLAMECSNGLHAVMLYTYPKIAYLNDTSQEIMDRIIAMNEKEAKAAYTYDAGPNAIVFTTAQHESETVSLLKEIVGNDNVTVTKMGKGPRLVR